MVNYKKGEYTYGVIKTIGDGTIEIGKFCSIANDVTAVLWGHRTDLFTTYPFGHSSETSDCPKNQSHLIRGNIYIGNDVWIGSNVTILYGTTIGDGCIISAGSVVRGKIKPYSLIAGNPAEKLFYRFNEETIELLLKLKWWNFSYEIIKENYETLMSNDYDKLLKFYEKVSK